MDEKENEKKMRAKYRGRGRRGERNGFHNNNENIVISYVKNVHKTEENFLYFNCSLLNKLTLSFSLSVARSQLFAWMELNILQAGKKLFWKEREREVTKNWEAKCVLIKSSCLFSSRLRDFPQERERKKEWWHDVRSIRHDDLCVCCYILNLHSRWEGIRFSSFFRFHLVLRTNQSLLFIKASLSLPTNDFMMLLSLCFECWHADYHKFSIIVKCI